MSDDIGEDLKRAIEETVESWVKKSPNQREVGKVRMHRDRLNGSHTVVIAVTARELANG